MRSEIEALLRACDMVREEATDGCDCSACELARAAAAVRASLAPKPVPDGELLPCPFCGGRTQIVTYGGDAGSFQGGRFVACMICESASLVCWGDEAADRRIAEAWNRRAELAREPVGYSDEGFARLMHETYERLAPKYGYETRPETREFDPTTPNGQLMIAVARHVARAARGEKP